MTPSDYPYASPEGAKSWQPGPFAPIVPQSSAKPGVRGSEFALGETDFVVPQLALIVAVIMVILSVFNATMVPVAVAMRPGPGPGFVFGLAYLSFLLGAFGGQAAMLTVLAVWGSGPLWRRLVWHWALALMAFSSWTFGFLVAMAIERFGEFPDEEFLAALTGMPLIALACQAVPWMLKSYFHWRIDPAAGEAPPAAAGQLTIRDMIVGTIVVALTMAALRLGKPANAPEGTYWAGWMIGAASAVGISLIALVPMVFLMLGVQQRAWGVVGVAAIAACIAATASGILMWLQLPGPSDKEIILMMVMIASGFTLTLCGTLWILRASDYRLATRPR